VLERDGGRRSGKSKRRRAQELENEDEVEAWGTVRNRRTLYRVGTWAEKQPGPLRFAHGLPRGAEVHALLKEAT
jgi:hypothetical protein